MPVSINGVDREAADVLLRWLTADDDSCPSVGVLLLFAERKLSDPFPDWLNAHVQTCARCHELREKIGIVLRLAAELRQHLEDAEDFERSS